MEGYQLDEEDLRNPSPETGVKLFKDLLWAESRRTGIIQANIDAPTAIFIPDGGLDAVIHDAEPAREDIIPKGNSGFQIKTSDVSDLEDEITNSDDELEERIRRLLEEGGTYILVIFEKLVFAESGTSKLEKRKNCLESLFEKYGFSNANVRVYDSNKLAGFINQFPALVANIKCFQYIKDYSTWQDEITYEIQTFVKNTKRNEKIKAIRAFLRESKTNCPTIRITGPSGIGKTRFVYEALSYDDLKTQVIYTNAVRFKKSGLPERLQMESKWNAIIVIDDCDPQDHKKFNDQFRSYHRLALITISDDPKTTDTDKHVKLEPLTKEDIVEILKNEDVETTDVERLADFSEGFPGIASLFVKNFSSESEASSEDLLNVPETTLERLIGGAAIQDFEQQKRVLELFSLFEKVGWKTESGEFHDESEWLAGFTSPAEKRKFRDIVNKQQARGILKGNYYISVTPPPLASNLIKSWLKTSRKLDLELLYDEVPDSLRIEFEKRIPYMIYNPIGESWISDKLGHGGFYYQENGANFSTERGSRLFLRLAEAAPSDAIKPLETFIKNSSKEELFDFSTGRRNIVMALEYMVVWEDTFERAAMLLLALAEAENETYSNNASGIFKKLFSPGPGRVAETEVAPIDRIPVLKNGLESDSKKKQLLSIESSNFALKTDNFVRVIGREYQGARPIPNLWTPNSVDDFLNYYFEVWNLLMGKIESFEDDLRKKASEVLSKKARGLVRIHTSSVKDAGCII